MRWRKICNPWLKNCSCHFEKYLYIPQLNLSYFFLSFQNLLWNVNCYLDVAFIFIGSISLFFLLISFLLLRFSFNSPSFIFCSIIFGEDISVHLVLMLKALVELLGRTKCKLDKMLSTCALVYLLTVHNFDGVKSFSWNI